MRHGNHIRFVTGLAILVLYFLTFMAHFFSSIAVASEVKSETGFLVVALDRGFLGNKETFELMSRFEQEYTARLALIGNESPGMEGKYEEYIRRAIEELEQHDINEIVVIPLFFSQADAVLNRFNPQLSSFVKSAQIRWAEPFGKSYLAAEILRDRIDSLSDDPPQERLVILGSGAHDEASESQIHHDLKQLAREATAGQAFREVITGVYYERTSDADLQKKNDELDYQVIRTAAKRGNTLVVPFAIGPKFDGHMSLEASMHRKFGEFDLAIGESILPHPDALTWLKRSANEYGPVSESKMAVLIMPHGSIQPYNDALEQVIAPLHRNYRIEMAYGMADPQVLKEAVNVVEREGYKRAVLVRMYALSGHMKAESDYILGVSRQPPVQDHHSGHASLPTRVRTSLLFETFGGYEEDPATAGILRERILEISERPEQETVILLAHGSRGDKENARWIDVMNKNIAQIEQSLPQPFRAIKAMTLREDWPELRNTSLTIIKDEIREGNKHGEVLIVSNRLYGSGPYQDLLKGLEFKMNGQGLVPHPALTHWLQQGIEQAMARTAGRAFQQIKSDVSGDARRETAMHSHDGS